jgi:hypothetical protein
MSIGLERALTLSSKQQAETWDYVTGLLVLFPVKRYHVLVTQGGQTYQVAVFAVTYPHREAGKGMGAPVVAQEAHYISLNMSRDELYEWLAVRQFPIEQGWEPVEEQA